MPAARLDMPMLVFDDCPVRDGNGRLSIYASPNDSNTSFRTSIKHPVSTGLNSIDDFHRPLLSCNHWPVPAGKVAPKGIHCQSYPEYCPVTVFLYIIHSGHAPITFLLIHHFIAFWVWSVPRLTDPTHLFIYAPRSISIKCSANSVWIFVVLFKSFASALSPESATTTVYRPIGLTVTSLSSMFVPEFPGEDSSPVILLVPYGNTLPVVIGGWIIALTQLDHARYYI